MSNSPLLDIRDLHTDIEIRSGVVHALSGVDLHVNAGETLGIVGESGSGKTMTALSLMGLLPPREAQSPPARSFWTDRT